jgi:hypothetical protein
VRIYHQVDVAGASADLGQCSLNRLIRLAPARIEFPIPARMIGDTGIDKYLLPRALDGGLLTRKLPSFSAVIL